MLGFLRHRQPTVLFNRCLLLRLRGADSADEKNPAQGRIFFVHYLTAIRQPMREHLCPA